MRVDVKLAQICPHRQALLALAGAFGRANACNGAAWVEKPLSSDNAEQGLQQGRRGQGLLLPDAAPDRVSRFDGQLPS